MSRGGSSSKRERGKQRKRIKEQKEQDSLKQLAQNQQRTKVFQDATLVENARRSFENMLEAVASLLRIDNDARADAQADVILLYMTQCCLTIEACFLFLRNSVGPEEAHKRIASCGTDGLKSIYSRCVNRDRLDTIVCSELKHMLAQLKAMKTTADNPLYTPVSGGARADLTAPTYQATGSSLLGCDAVSKKITLALLYNLIFSRFLCAHLQSWIIENRECMSWLHDMLLENISADKFSQTQMNKFLIAAYETDKALLQAKIIKVLKGAAEMEEHPQHLEHSLNIYMDFALSLIKEDKNPELLAIVHDTLLKNLSEDKSSQSQMNEFLMDAYEADKVWLQAKIIEVLKGAATMTEQPPAHLEYSLNLYMAFALYFIRVERNPELLFAVVKDYPSQFNKLISAKDCLKLVSIITIHSLYGINPNFVKYILADFFASASSDYKDRFVCNSSGDIDKFIKSHREKSLDLLPLLIDLVRIWIDQSVNDNDVLKVAGFIQRIMQILKDEVASDSVIVAAAEQKAAATEGKEAATEGKEAATEGKEAATEENKSERLKEFTKQLVELLPGEVLDKTVATERAPDPLNDVTVFDLLSNLGVVESLSKLDSSGVFANACLERKEQQLAAAKSAQAKLQKERDAAKSALAQLQKELTAALGMAQSSQEDLAASRDRHKEQQDKLQEELAAALARAQSSQKELAASRAIHKEQQEKLQKELAAAKSAPAQLQEELAAALARAQSSQEDLAASRAIHNEQQAKLQEERDAAKAEPAKSRKDLASAKSAQAKLQKERAAAWARAESSKKELKAARAKSHRLQQELTVAEASVESFQTGCDAARLDLAVSKSKQDQLQARFIALQSEHAAVVAERDTASADLVAANNEIKSFSAELDRRTQEHDDPECASELQQKFDASQEYVTLLESQVTCLRVHIMSAHDLSARVLGSSSPSYPQQMQQQQDWQQQQQQWLPPYPQPPYPQQQQQQMQQQQMQQQQQPPAPLQQQQWPPQQQPPAQPPPQHQQPEPPQHQQPAPPQQVSAQPPSQRQQPVPGDKDHFPRLSSVVAGTR